MNTLKPHGWLFSALDGIIKVAGNSFLALVVAIIGTALFLALRAVLYGLLDPLAYIPLCFMGAFVSSLIFATPAQRPFSYWLSPAVRIVLLTYIFIAVGHLVHHIGNWDHTVPTEAINLVIWAIITTSWWLVPLTAAVLMGFSRIILKYSV